MREVEKWDMTVERESDARGDSLSNNYIETEIGDYNDDEKKASQPAKSLY